MLEVIDKCRLCGRAGLRRFLDLGMTPLADRLVVDPEADELRFPLTVHLCRHCSLVQVAETVDPGLLFGEDYPYYSSVSSALLEHSRANADHLIQSRNLSGDDLVIEIASNDGYLLQFFARQGIPVLGIDPTPGPAAVATDRGIPTLVGFFGSDLADELARTGKMADVVIANNVLAHVPDTNGFVAGIRKVLKPRGVAVLEAPYVRDLVEKAAFDTIYHEHLCYFSATALSALFGRNGLTLHHVERTPIHGGSLRMFVRHQPGRSESLERLLAEEHDIGLSEFDYYRDFGTTVEGIKTRLIDLLTALKDRGERIAAYGAAAKGSTMLNYTGVGTRFLDYVVDLNPYKQGKYMPGVHLEIRDPRVLLDDMPDYLLVLAWNFISEITHQQAEYANRGGRFIVPVPEPTLV